MTHSVKNILLLSALLFREETKGRGWVFWPVLFPLILVTAIYLQSNGVMHPETFPIFLSFAAVVTSTQGTGAFLIGRREAGFLKAFVSFPAAQQRYLVAQMIAGFCFTAIIVIIFTVILSLYFQTITVADSLLFGSRALLVVFLVGVASTILNIVPLKFRTVLAAVTATFAPMLLLAFAMNTQFSSHPFVVIGNIINPVSVGAAIIGDGIVGNITSLIIWAIVSLSLLGITARWFSVDTYWDK